MQASVVDLRYKMSDVIKALDRKERVEILYHGKKKGIIVAAQNKKKVKVTEHPFFGMLSDEEQSVSELMEDLRGGRYNDL